MLERPELRRVSALLTSKHLEEPFFRHRAMMTLAMMQHVVVPHPSQI